LWIIDCQPPNCNPSAVAPTETAWLAPPEVAGELCSATGETAAGALAVAGVGGSGGPAE
jgi:hypothetical protein